MATVVSLAVLSDETQKAESIMRDTQQQGRAGERKNAKLNVVLGLAAVLV